MIEHLPTSHSTRKSVARRDKDGNYVFWRDIPLRERCSSQLKATLKMYMQDLHINTVGVELVNMYNWDLVLYNYKRYTGELPRKKSNLARSITWRDFVIWAEYLLLDINVIQNCEDLKMPKNKIKSVVRTYNERLKKRFENKTETNSIPKTDISKTVNTSTDPQTLNNWIVKIMEIVLSDKRFSIIDYALCTDETVEEVDGFYDKSTDELFIKSNRLLCAVNKIIRDNEYPIINLSSRKLSRMLKDMGYIYTGNNKTFKRGKVILGKLFFLYHFKNISQKHAILVGKNIISRKRVGLDNWDNIKLDNEEIEILNSLDTTDDEFTEKDMEDHISDESNYRTDQPVTVHKINRPKDISFEKHGKNISIHVTEKDMTIKISF